MGPLALGPPTRFERCSPVVARVVLALIVIVMIAGALVSRATSERFSRIPATGADLAFYAHVVERVRGGEDYYRAAYAELVAGDYPRWSVFHYRLPTYAWLFSRVSDAIVRVLVSALALVTALVWYPLLRRRVGALIAVAALLLLAGLWQACGDLYLVSELWAGILIALSLAARLRNLLVVALVAAALALALRELTLPYVLVCAMMARDRRERVAWLALCVSFALAMFFHARAVPAEFVVASDGNRGWLSSVGGLQFLLLNCRVNALLLAVPLAISVIYLPLSIVGAWADRDDDPLGAVVTVYVLLLALVGLASRFYWGLIWQPLAILGVARAPAVVRDLLRRATGR